MSKPATIIELLTTIVDQNKVGIKFFVPTAQPDQFPSYTAAMVDARTIKRNNHYLKVRTLMLEFHARTMPQKDQSREDWFFDVERQLVHGENLLQGMISALLKVTYLSGTRQVTAFDLNDEAGVVFQCSRTYPAGHNGEPIIVSVSAGIRYFIADPNDTALPFTIEQAALQFCQISV